MNPRIIVYATIIQLAAFAIFDQGNDPITDFVYRNIIVVSLGPMFAVAVAHMFAEVLDHHIERGENFTLQEARPLLKQNLQFLYVGLAPLVIALPFLFTDVSANTVVNVIFVFGIASLFFWGALAARHSGRTPAKQLAFALAYGILGLLVVGIELFLAH
jgi:VIT1/CCC1 family predicted Fe2+/Mn2+ transporter